MKRYLLACAAGALSAAAAAAQSPAPAAATPAPFAPSPPVMYGSSFPTSGTVTSSTTSTRRGLFSRLRGGRTSVSGSVMSSPVTMPLPSTGTVITTPGTGGVMPGTVVPAPMPSTGTVVPAPMPVVAPRPAGMSSAMPAVTGTPIVLAGGTGDGVVVPSGGVVMPGTGMVMPAGGFTTTYDFFDRNVPDRSVVVPASGVMMPGVMTTTAAGCDVAAAPATMMPMMVMTTVSSTTTSRTGLFGRVRARR